MKLSLGFGRKHFARNRSFRFRLGASIPAGATGETVSIPRKVLLLIPPLGCVSGPSEDMPPHIEN